MPQRPMRLRPVEDPATARVPLACCSPAIFAGVPRGTVPSRDRPPERCLRGQQRISGPERPRPPSRCRQEVVGPAPEIPAIAAIGPSRSRRWARAGARAPGTAPPPPGAPARGGVRLGRGTPVLVGRVENQFPVAGLRIRGPPCGLGIPGEEQRALSRGQPVLHPQGRLLVLDPPLLGDLPGTAHPRELVVGEPELRVDGERELEFDDRLVEPESNPGAAAPGSSGDTPPGCQSPAAGAAHSARPHRRRAPSARDGPGRSSGR